ADTSTAGATASAPAGFAGSIRDVFCTVPKVGGCTDWPLAPMVHADSPAMTITGSSTAACVASWLRPNGPNLPNHDLPCSVIAKPSTTSRVLPRRKVKAVWAQHRGPD